MSASQEDVAAKEFKVGIPALRKLVMSNINEKDAKRLLISLVEFPLEKSVKNFSNEKLCQEIFQLANHLLMCKMVMISAVVKEKQKEKEDGRQEGTSLDEGGLNSPQPENGQTLSEG